MNKSRRMHSAKVALAAIRGDETVADLASHLGVHSCQIQARKKALMVGASELLNKSDGKRDDQGAIEDQLYRQIGQLTVENDF